MSGLKKTAITTQCWKQKWLTVDYPVIDLYSCVERLLLYSNNLSTCSCHHFFYEGSCSN